MSHLSWLCFIKFYNSFHYCWFQTTKDLNEADKKRREEFKEYEMQKKFEQEQKLKGNGNKLGFILITVECLHILESNC